MTFLSIALIAFIVLVGGFFLGHDFHADHGFDGEGASVFSTRVLGVFALGLGAAGAIATLSGWPAVVALLCGVISGGVLALATWGFFALLSSQQASSLVPSGELVGCFGVVVTAIGREAVGEVAVSRGEVLATFLARAAAGTGLAKGQAIRVVRATGSLLFVEEASPLLGAGLQEFTSSSNKERP
jgi:membrane protein implicated in regulation of membrane protease activity